MFKRLELADKINKEWKGKTYIGYDLGAGYGEISVFTEQDTRPVTLLSRNDATVFHFPCMLVKYEGRFYAGFEAQHMAQKEGAFVFEDLLELAIHQPTIVVGGQRFETDYLLGLFLKLTLVLSEDYGKPEKAGGIIFTTYLDEDPALQLRLYEILTRAAAQLFDKRMRLYLLTRSESIYYFLMHQEESFYQENTLVCDYQKDYLKTYYLQRHGKEAPFTLSVERMDYPDMQLLEEKGSVTDEMFYQVIEDLEQKYEFGLSYLIGDGFKGDWMERSLNQLCEHGRVFQGNNLYSLGACYCLRQVIEPTPILKDHILLGQQDILCDVGILAKKQSVWDVEKTEYIPVFEHGTPFMECKTTFFVIPQGEREVTICIKLLTESETRIEKINVEALGDTKVGDTKWKVDIHFLDEKTLLVMIEDIGLGEVAAGTGKSVQKTIDLRQAEGGGER